MNKKKINIRVFNVDTVNRSLGEPSFDVVTKINDALKCKRTADKRRMSLNAQDTDEDILAYFDATPDYIFGMMMRIAPTETTGTIPNEIFQNEKFSFNDISKLKDETNTKIYKDYYYFLLNNNYLLTNLSGKYSVECFQTYLNWLCKDTRGDNLISFLPKLALSEDLKLSDLKKIEIGENTILKTNLQTESRLKFKNKLSDFLKEIFDFNDNVLNDIDVSQFFTANLVLKLNSKQKELTDENYERILGAIVKPLTNDSNVVILGKNNKRLLGANVNCVKEITVEKTSSDNINEQQLKQEMEKILLSFRTK